MSQPQNLAEQLQASLDALRNRNVTPFNNEVPLPLAPAQRVLQAKRLRDIGMDYTAVAQAMGVYHGEWYSAGAWVERLKRAGMHEPKHHANGSKRVPPQVLRAES